MRRVAHATRAVQDVGQTMTVVCGAGEIAKRRQMMESIRRQLEELAENICDNFCKYRETCDENCECDWIREDHECPLDRLL